MDPYFRSLSIHDEGGDPTLDPNPISSAMPPANRLLAGYGALLIYAAAGLLLALVPSCFIGPEARLPPIGPGRGASFAVLLREVALPPLENHEGGAGGTLAGDGQPLAPARAPGDLAPSLPVGPAGGTGPLGLGGTGSGGNGGAGSGWGVRATPSKVRPLHDFQLIPILMPRARHDLLPGEDGSVAAVEVSLTVEDDGRVSRALPVSGPTFLFPSVLEAALRWRFEPLAPHGLKGPQEVKVRFICSFGNAR